MRVNISQVKFYTDFKVGIVHNFTYSKDVYRVGYESNNRKLRNTREIIYHNM